MDHQGGAVVGAQEAASASRQEMERLGLIRYQLDLALRQAEQAHPLNGFSLLAGIHRVRFPPLGFRGPGGVIGPRRPHGRPPADAITALGRWAGHRWAQRPSRVQAAAGPEGWMPRRSWRWQVRSGTARSAAGPGPAGTGAPRASGWAGAGATAARSGSAGRAGPGSGSAGSWW